VDDIQNVFEQVKKVCHPIPKLLFSTIIHFGNLSLKFAELIGLKKKTPLQNWLNTRDINNLLFVSGFDVYRNTKRLIFPLYIPYSIVINKPFLAKFPFFRFFSLNLYSFAKPLT
jgi:hypothetical protein